MSRKSVSSGPAFTSLPWAFCLLLGFGISSCSDPVDSEPVSYPAPLDTGDGWATASPSDVGMDPAPLVALLDAIRAHDGHFLHSVLVVRNGQLVFEEYFDGRQFDLVQGSPWDYEPVSFGINTLQFQGSVSKSITSALVGIALDRGMISDIDAPLFSFFPDYQDLSTPEKEEITIAHLLTMRAGWPWYDDDIDGEGSDEVQMFQHEDPLRFILERPLEWVPGSYMEYHSGSTVLLGEIVRRVSGMSLVDFAYQFLFQPLGIEEAIWADCRNAPGVAFAGGGLYLRPRDMAKIGQLFLQSGLWEGTRVISSEWVSRSVQTVVISQSRTADHYLDTGYGYLWWTGRFDGGYEAYMAKGWGGQFIVVIPELDLVTVVTGGNYDVNSSSADVPFSIYDDIVYGHVLPAIR